MKAPLFVICLLIAEASRCKAFAPHWRSQVIRAETTNRPSPICFASIDGDASVEEEAPAEKSKDLVVETMQDPDIEAMLTEGEESEEGSQIPSPAAKENKKFICDESVKTWSTYEPPRDIEASIRRLNDINSRFVRKGPDAMNYFARHMGARYGYFGANTLLGGLATVLHERLVNSNNNDGGIGDTIDKISLANGMFAPLSMVNRAVELATVFEQDYENICNGKYAKPYDMYEQTRQSNPFFIAQQSNLFAREAIGTLTRRSRGNQEDKDLWLSNDYSPDLYPKYYRTQFHYQTDGWMSKESANVYETSTETLFMGGQDAMQRQSIFPVTTAYEKFKASDENRPFRVLEVACGTGRFGTFLRDNLPANVDYTAVDLSPFYLDAARENDANWRRMKKRQLSRDSSDRDIVIPPTRVVQAKAEDLPFAAGEFDAVVCIHLFHELPRSVRTKVASEMARVAKTGGCVVFNDSVQLGDQPWLDENLLRFENFNEPYYVDYLRDDIPSHFESAGLECESKTQCFRSKCLTFTKP